jgi:hypothetical protein
VARTSFDTKVSILSRVWTHYRNDEAWKEIVFDNATGFAFAYGLDVDYFSIRDDWEGAEQDVLNLLDISWEALLQELGLDDKGFTDWNDLIEKANA